MNYLRLPSLLVAILLVVFFSVKTTTQSSLLLQASNLIYAGAFRVADSNFNGSGGTAMSFDNSDGQLWIGNHGRIAKISIPPLVISNSVTSLNTATLTQPFVQRGVDLSVFTCSEAKLIGGSLPWLGNLIVSGYCYYDASVTETRSHWKVTGNSAVGPFVVGTNAGFPNAGFVGGPMATIPADWQGLLGGPALTGLWGIPIISRSSAGPTASVFNPSDVGSVNPVPATKVVGYPLDHAVLGNDGDGTLFSTTQQFGGMVFPVNTGTVLFFAGKKSLGPFCYGAGTPIQSLHNTIDPNTGGRWCYDPVNWDQGNHGYPYAHFVYAYRASDLVSVKQGLKQTWEILPYATWTFDLPFQHGERVINGVAYDQANQLIYIALRNGDPADIDKPLIHAYKLDISGTPPPPPPNQPVDAVLSSWSFSSTSDWSTCVNGVRTRTETWTRTIISPAEYGGTTGPLSEQRVVEENCVTPPEPPITDSLLTVIRTCLYPIVVATPPAIGYTNVQFQRSLTGAYDDPANSSNWTRHGNRDSSAPYTGSASLTYLDWRFRGVWNGAGMQTIFTPITPTGPCLIP